MLVPLILALDGPPAIPQVLDATVDTTNTTLTKRVRPLIDATVTNVTNLIRSGLKVLNSTVTSSSFVETLLNPSGPVSVVIFATATTSSAVSKGIGFTIDAIANTISFAGKQFKVTLNAIVNTALLLISSTQRIIFSFGVNVIKALDQNVFETRRTIFAYQEEEGGSPPPEISGSFVCNVDGGSGIWSGASGTFNLDFDE